jgi:glycosyltransferase involved in cell wall biosynthesis
MSTIIESELSQEYTFDTFNRSDLPQDLHGRIRKALFKIGRLRSFFTKLRAGGYEFTHIHSADSAFLGTIVFMLAARVAGTKILLHMHGTDWDIFYTRSSGFKKFCIKAALWLPKLTIVLYRLWAENIRKIYPSMEIRVVRNLIHRTAAPDPVGIQQLRGRLGLAPNDFVVVTVGTVGRRKGSFEIVQAAERVASLDQAIKFVLVGGEERPGEMEQLNALIHDRDLKARVILTGETPRDNVPLFLGLADVFLLPSFIEGMPMAIIEAMQQGLPVISTRVGGIPEMLDERQSGILIHPGAPDEIMEAVSLLKNDHQLRNRLSEGARKAFDEKFEVTAGIQEIRSLYETLSAK